MWRRILTIVIVLLAVLIVGVFWFRAERNSAKSAVVSVPDYVAAEGRISVKPDRRAVLSAQVNGRIDRILVDHLAGVTKGQLLAVLYNADLEHKIRQTEEAYRKAEAYHTQLRNGAREEDLQEAAAVVKKAESDLELALRNEERDRKLFEQEVLAPSKLDATIAERKRAESELEAVTERYQKLKAGERAETIEAARAEALSERFALESLKATYEKTFVRSPLDGIVIRRYRNASEFADVGDPIVEVADLSDLIVEADVNEIDVGKVRTGQRVTITTDAFPGTTFSGEVYEVGAALKQRESEPQDPSVVVDQKILPIKVRFLKRAPLKLGMKVDLKISVPGASA